MMVLVVFFLVLALLLLFAVVEECAVVGVLQLAPARRILAVTAWQVRD